VLAGGGSLGAVQAGMLIEIVAAGVRPDLVVGVSAGAINGAFFAFDPTAGMVERMADLWRRVRTRDVLSPGWGTVLGFLGLRNYLVRPDGLRRLLERELPYRDFAAARVPLHVVAADQRTGAEVLLSAGALVESILASAAIPGVFPPVQVGGRTLVDGVVAAGTPIATACRLGASRLIVLPCGFTCIEDAVPRHPVGRAMHAITLLGARQLRQDYAHYSDRADIQVVPPLCPLSQSSYDYSQGAALIEAARLSTRRWLDAGGLGRREFPHELEIHTHH
jgi:NTE family protein